MLSTMIKTAVSVVLLTSAMASFAGHLTVSKEVTVNASPETTWKMIGDFNHLDVWHPVVVESQLKQGDSQSAGAVRLLTLGNGATITEKLVSNNNALRTYTYAITESPLPVSDYVSTITVSAAEGGKSTVTWSSSFDANGASDEEAESTISGIYDAGLNNLDKYFNQ
ncbi:MAG: SRPBCC family protein [Gammaproteobacteria bacterium]|nr:MAG: SRPBCC family protein [Gammaproteobacteria bacterium]RLA02300.1 MAG: SRPBCC family protein [Gammaproteobacteria bacterium]